MSYLKHLGHERKVSFREDLRAKLLPVIEMIHHAVKTNISYNYKVMSG